MKLGGNMKQVLLKKGKVIVENVSLPYCYDDGVLVKTLYSAVSVGTESNSVKSRKSPVLTALKNPNLVKKVWENVKKQGLLKTKELVDSKLHNYINLGYIPIQLYKK